MITDRCLAMRSRILTAYTTPVGSLQGAPLSPAYYSRALLRTNSKIGPGLPLLTFSIVLFDYLAPSPVPRRVFCPKMRILGTKNAINYLIYTVLSYA